MGGNRGWKANIERKAMGNKVSIIVPVYNGEKTIKRCVDSILAQSYDNIELIVVNDGSIDATENILGQYSDSRMRVITKANAGVAAARNTALEIATGEFVCFVDADDSVLPNYVSDLYAAMDDDADLVISYAIYCEGDNEKPEKYSPIKVDDSSFEKIFYHNDIDWHTAPWAKLFRMSVIKDQKITFPDSMRLGEDCVFLYRYMALSHGVNIMSATNYRYYAFEGGSLTKRLYDTEYEQYLSSRIDECVDVLIEHKSIKDAKAMAKLWNLRTSYTHRILDSLYFRGSASKEERLEIIRNIGVERFRKFAVYGSIRNRVLLGLLRCGCFKTYDRVRMMAKRKRNL